MKETGLKSDLEAEVHPFVKSHTAWCFHKLIGGLSALDIHKVQAHAMCLLRKLLA